MVNLDFHKSVSVRYTTNDWSSQHNVVAQYLSGTADGFSDRFSFIIDASSVFAGRVGSRYTLLIFFLLLCLDNALTSLLDLKQFLKDSLYLMNS